MRALSIGFAAITAVAAAAALIDYYGALGWLASVLLMVALVTLLERVAEGRPYGLPAFLVLFVIVVFSASYASQNLYRVLREHEAPLEHRDELESARRLLAEDVEAAKAIALPALASNKEYQLGLATTARERQARGEYKNPISGDIAVAAAEARVQAIEQQVHEWSELFIDPKQAVGPGKDEGFAYLARQTARLGQLARSLRAEVASRIKVPEPPLPPNAIAGNRNYIPPGLGGLPGRLQAIGFLPALGAVGTPLLLDLIPFMLALARRRELGLDREDDDDDEDAHPPPRSGMFPGLSVALSRHYAVDSREAGLTIVGLLGRYGGPNKRLVERTKRLLAEADNAVARDLTELFGYQDQSQEIPAKLRDALVLAEENKADARYAAEQVRRLRMKKRVCRKIYGSTHRADQLIEKECDAAWSAIVAYDGREVRRARPKEVLGNSN
ncbi:MAG: hypothetical protein M3R13_08575 [Armatimonadota bacterium]|nr:hypothetical protein [Armatimonadota bacterium]